MDLAYTDYALYKQLNGKEIFFVSRLKSKARYRVADRRAGAGNQGVLCNQTFELTGIQTVKQGLPKLHRTSYQDAGSGKHDVYVTNNFKLATRNGI